MRLPEDVEGLGSCEVSTSSPSFCFRYNTKRIDTNVVGLWLQYTMDRGIVHACHAGGVVHSLEGWSHNEVGAIDVDRIDLVWEAALKHGFKPITTLLHRSLS